VTKQLRQLGVKATVAFPGFRGIHSAVSTDIRDRWAKTIVFVLCMIPSLIFSLEAGKGSFGVHARATVIRQSGDWTIYFLILTLAITPLRRYFNLPELIRFRRMLGIFAFFYGCLHVVAWRALKLGHTLQMGSFTIWSLRIGFVGFVLMIPLAITSTDSWVRWLGGKRWRALHTLAYMSAVAGIVHYCLLPNIGVWKPALISALVASLLLVRIRTLTTRVHPAQSTTVDASASQGHDSETVSSRQVR
jgi:sulfoxide reductase heme-binding subunit YedZ